jgi:hypothetical protein
MRIKTGLLAIAGALTLAAPVAAMAQSYGYAPEHRYYGSSYGEQRFDRGDFRRMEREREFRRRQWLAHQRWEREHRGYGWDYR